MLGMKQNGATTEKPTSPPPPAEKLNFPKDSKRAWLACFCAFQSQVLIVGTLHGFGVFFVEFTEEFDTTRGKAAWISSLAYGISMLTGPVASTLNNKYEQRYVMMLGCGLCAIAALSSSFVTSFPVLFLSFSVTFGFGASLAITCTVAVSQEYFDKNVTIAMGIIAAGSSFGTLVMSPLSRFLIDSVGWRHSFRIIAGTCALSMLCNMLLTPIQPRKQISLLQVRSSPLRKLMEDLKLWKNRVFIVWTCAITCVMFGYYIPYVHMVSYATDCGISPGKASILLMILGAATAFGRIVFGKVVQIGLLDRIRMHQLSMVITGAGTMFLPAITTFSGIASYIVVVGLVDGCYVVLLPLLTCSLFGSERMVLAWGFLVGTCSVTFTLGPPIAGFIYDATGSYNLAFHIAGIPILSGAIIMFLIPWAQRTSQTTNVLKELEVPQPDQLDDVDLVDFITLSRVPSIISSARESKITLVASRRDNESVSIAPESVSLLDADWGAYFVNNLNQMTIVPGNTTLRAGMREVDFDLSALERTDQVLSEMLRGGVSPASQSIRLSGPALIVNSSPRCQSCKNSYKKSDVINISSSCTRQLAAHRRSKDEMDEAESSVSNVGVQTDLTFSNHSTSPQFHNSFTRSRPSPIPFVPASDMYPQREFASTSTYNDVTPATTPSEGFISGYKGKLKETPKGSTRVLDPISKNRTALSITNHHLRNRTIDEHDSPVGPLPFNSTAEPLFGPDVNLPNVTEPSLHSPQFYTSHNRLDYGTTQHADETNGETLPVDIPTPDHDTSAKGSEFDMFHMELPPSPHEIEESILKLPRSPPPVHEILPKMADDSDIRLVFTADDIANRLLLIADDSDDRKPLDTGAVRPPSPLLQLSPRHSQEAVPQKVEDVHTTPEVPENNLTPTQPLQSSKEPAAATALENKWEDFSEHPVRTDSSAMAIQAGAVFDMDPLSPPVTSSITNIPPSPTPAENVTVTHSDHENTVSTSSNEQTHKDAPNRSLSPVIPNEDSTQQTASSGSTSQGSHSNLMFKMDPVVRDSQSDSSKSSARDEECDDSHDDTK